MHIIYHCFGGAHSSVTAASIHLGIISDQTIPSKEALLALPYFDQTVQDDHGHLRYFGSDEAGHQIYIIGRRGLKKYFPSLVKTFANLTGIPYEEFMIVNTIPCVNWMMMLGGYTSRRLGWTKFGRPIVLKGTQKAFSRLADTANKTRLAAQGDE